MDHVLGEIASPKGPDHAVDTAEMIIAGTVVEPPEEWLAKDLYLQKLEADFGIKTRLGRCGVSICTRPSLGFLAGRPTALCFPEDGSKPWILLVSIEFFTLTTS